MSPSPTGNSAAAKFPTVFLSVVIPAYNETCRIVSTLNQVLAYVQARSENCEVLILDDGSTDGTAQLVEQLCREIPAARAIFSRQTIPGFGFRMQGSALMGEEEAAHQRLIWDRDDHLAGFGRNRNRLLGSPLRRD